MDDVKFNFEDLKVYRKALDFVDMVYDITEKFPKNEKYGLTSQYTRAAQSIALNIAEGAGDSDAQFNRFIQIAKGSIKECIVCSTIAKRQNFISQKEDKHQEKHFLQLLKCELTYKNI